MSLKNKKILVTCGPTWAPIDAMRVISNRSTGKMGQHIAQDFQKAGAKVTLLEGPVDQPLKTKTIRVVKFTFFNEFSALIKKELKKKYDVCIHAAAVSDYKVKEPKQTKIRSRIKSLKLNLIPTPKIIAQIKRLNPKIFLVGFKLESNMTQTSAKHKVNGLFTKDHCDLVIANSVQGKKYTGFILDKNKTILERESSRKQISKALVHIIKDLQ